MEKQEEYMASLRAWLRETEDEPLTEMAAFFTAHTEDYEEHMRPWRACYEWLASLVPAATKTLLDLGCGTGLELDEIFRRLPEVAVTGIDLSAAMLAILRKKHPDKALTLIQGDYFTVRFGSGCFDTAVSVETLHHFTPEKKRLLFRKLFDALRPGGVYLQTDYAACCDEEERLLRAVCARKRRRDGIPATQYVHFDTPLTAAHELALLRQAGFHSVELLGYRGEDDHTPLLRATKEG